ncbi:MAG TPA: hypothetical protein VM870_07845 [Pyrinomonadaceae bacterium]|jgi:hypothetical protein|nr:hypothetical protein [Pyrinomonadaceae bacterium]
MQTGKAKVFADGEYVGDVNYYLRSVPPDLRGSLVGAIVPGLFGRENLRLLLEDGQQVRFSVLDEKGSILGQEKAAGGGDDAAAKTGESGFGSPD